MIRKDFLVKQFEEFGKVLARLLMLRKENLHAELSSEIDQATKRFTGLEPGFVENLEDEKLLELTLGLEDEKLKMLSDLLFEKYHFCLLSENLVEAENLKERCIRLYRLTVARQQNNFDMDIYYKLQFLGVSDK